MSLPGALMILAGLLLLVMWAAMLAQIARSGPRSRGAVARTPLVGGLSFGVGLLLLLAAVLQLTASSATPSVWMLIPVSLAFLWIGIGILRRSRASS